MAESADPIIGGTRSAPRFDHQPGYGYVIPSHADLIFCLASYENYFNDVDKHPEADVRQRFLRERCMRAQYVEWLVMVRQNAWDELLRDVRMRKVDPNDEGYLEKHATAVRGLNEALSWSSKYKSSSL